MKIIFVNILLLLIMLSCATTLTRAGAKVKVMKSDPQEDCKEIDTLTVNAPTALSAKNMLQNEAAEVGANYVRLDTANGIGNMLTGTAFKCPIKK